jgi:predicted DNA-binding helix-hairpin-helix protein
VDTEQKLNILADAGKFDLACACKYNDEPGRVRGPEGRWIYPATLPSGQKVFLLKTLQSNHCVNDCSYCPFNNTRDLARCTLLPDDLARTFIQLRDANLVSGLFLSSGVCHQADATMTKMLATVELLRRKYKFRGFIHLKILPGSSEAAIEQAVRLATRVSINIEAPNAPRLEKLSSKKRFYEDILSVMRTIHRYKQELKPKCGQTTQFVVGAAGESDREIVTTTSRLYEKFQLERVYFSAYQNFNVNPRPSQPTLFDDVPRKHIRNPDDIFMREHRLYQTEFLLRKYKFDREDIYFDENGNLSLQTDPKKIWAERHPEFFPVNLNRADRFQLLRVPGIGPLGASRILKARRFHSLRSPTDLKPLKIRTNTCAPYIRFS